MDFSRAQTVPGLPSLVSKVGKYEVIRELGKGATSAVYQALDPFQNRQVAVKVVFPEALGDKEHGKRYRKLFVTEASLAGKLSHPHIVAIYDAVADDEASYIVMEYVDGTTLEQYTRHDALLPIQRIVEIVYKCARALEYATREGVIHRDIKPANILLAGESDIKIMDFGAALTLAAETTQVSGVGSPAYMSPEQVKEQPLTYQTDIFSLGVVMYQLLTGRLPFQGTNNYSMIYQIINVDPPPPMQVRPDIPPRVDAIVMRALAKDAAARYQTWDELAHDLATALGKEERREPGFAESEKFDTLRKLEFFRHFTDVELWEVLRLATWHKHPRDTVLIQEDDIGSSFFILISGEVKVVKQDRLLNVLNPGECFGEMAYLGKQKFQRSASVVALSEIAVIEIRAETLSKASDLCRHHFHGAFLELLVDRLAMANMRLSQMLADRNISVF
ncbi:MAG: serine/threonine protein kinase [Betaproteobacteria bacterium RIFCSPLOWO2_02_FULL_67_26]|nr:MAG: serine/threonine protein kinase [Betaproteobacteria bacterium RIFCSPLOWO2_02_FULL_67_26]